MFLPLGYIFVAFAVFWFWMTDGRARHASRNFLTRIFQSQNKKQKVHWWHTIWHMNVYGLMLLDRSVSLADSRGKFRISPATGDGWLERLVPGRGVLMLTAHFGAAELSAPMLKRMGAGRKAHFVVYRDMSDATEQFHRDQWTSLADIQWINSTEPISAGLAVMAALKKGDVVAMRADRAVRGRCLDAMFFGQRVQLPAGPFTAAVLSGAMVVNAFTVRAGYRQYIMHISTPKCYALHPGLSRDELIGRAVADYLADLEAIVERYPYQWGNFYDFWKSDAQKSVPEVS